MPQSDQTEHVRHNTEYFRDVLIRVCKVQRDPVACAEALRETHQRWRAALGVSIAPAINSLLDGSSRLDVAVLRNRVAAVNALLDELGLGIQCPSTGVPCRLGVDRVEHNRGKVRLVCDNPDGPNRRRITLARFVLPEVAVIPNDRPIGARKAWQQRSQRHLTR